MIAQRRLGNFAYLELFDRFLEICRHYGYSFSGHFFGGHLEDVASHLFRRRESILYTVKT